MGDIVGRDAKNVLFFYILLQLPLMGEMLFFTFYRNHGLGPVFILQTTDHIGANLQKENFILPSSCVFVLSLTVQFISH